MQIAFIYFLKLQFRCPLFPVILAQAEICRQMLPSSKIEVFECPRIFESKIKSWCCGSNTLKPNCCPWSERAKEAGLSRFHFVTPHLFMFLLGILVLSFVFYLYFKCRYFCHFLNSDYSLHPVSNTHQSSMVPNEEPPSYLEALADPIPTSAFSATNNYHLASSNCSAPVQHQHLSHHSKIVNQELSQALPSPPPLYTSQLPYNPNFNNINTDTNTNTNSNPHPNPNSNTNNDANTNKQN